MLSIISGAFGPLYFGEMSIQVFCPFFDWVVYYFDTELFELFVDFRDKSLLVTLFENIFSHSVDCLFILFLVSCAVQKKKMLSLIRSYLFIFVFIFITLRDRSIKILLQYFKECSSYVFLYEFYSSDFTFKSLNQFELSLCMV